MSELDGRRNSNAAKAYIKQCFADLKDLRPVSFMLTTATADKLTEACDQVNVWRDAFVNRVVYLLVAKSTAIEHQFDFEFTVHAEAIFDDWLEIKSLLLEPGSPRSETSSRRIRSAGFEPLSVANMGRRGRLHDRPIGRPTAEKTHERGLAGFTVYLEDKDVPGTKENEAWQKHIAELFSLL